MAVAKNNSSSAGQSSLHFGVIDQVFANGTAIVRLEDMDGLKTMPIPVGHQNTHNRIWYWMPEVGQRCACLMDEKAEQGIILCGIYSEANPPPVADLNKFYFKFDNITIEGDRTTGVVKINATKLQIVTTTPSILQGKEIVVIGGTDNDSEGNGTDSIVQSGQ